MRSNCNIKLTRWLSFYKSIKSDICRLKQYRCNLGKRLTVNFDTISSSNWPLTALQPSPLHYFHQNTASTTELPPPNHCLHHKTASTITTTSTTKLPPHQCLHHKTVSTTPLPPPPCGGGSPPSGDATLNIMEPKRPVSRCCESDRSNMYM